MVINHQDWMAKKDTYEGKLKRPIKNHPLEICVCFCSPGWEHMKGDKGKWEQKCHLGRVYHIPPGRQERGPWSEHKINSGKRPGYGGDFHVPEPLLQVYLRSTILIGLAAALLLCECHAPQEKRKQRGIIAPESILANKKLTVRVSDRNWGDCNSLSWSLEIQDYGGNLISNMSEGRTVWCHYGPG